MEYTYTVKSNKKRKLYDENIPDEDKILFEDYSSHKTNIKYNSFFFRSDILFEYTKKINKIFKKNNKISVFKENYKLYNMDDIVYYLLNKPGVRTRNYNKIIQSNEWIKIKKYIIALIPLILGKICSGTVNEGYTKQTFNKNIKKIISGEVSHIYDDDIVIMAPREIEHYISYKKIMKTKKARINNSNSDSESDSKSNSDSDSDSDSSDKEDYILKRDEDINEELNEDIEEEYLVEMEDIIEKINDFEELNFASYEEQFKEKLKMIVGFMIVSRGKCKIFPNDYILNLICTNMSGVGSILIGLYLYTILKHPIVPITTDNLLMTEDLELSGNASIYYDKIKKSKTFKQKYKNESKYGINIFERKFMTTDDLIPTNGIAILELAYAYYNYPGLCLYEKIGFKYDKYLFFKKYDVLCVYDYGNLPMSIDFSDDNTSGCYAGLSIEEKMRKILNIIVGNEQCSRNKICSIQNNTHKKLLSALNELILYQDARMKFDNISNYDIIKNEEINELNSILDIINQIKPSGEINYNYIKQIIDDVENNNITPEVERLLNHFVGGKRKNISKKNKNITKKNKNITKKNKNITKKNKNITKKIKYY